MSLATGDQEARDVARPVGVDPAAYLGHIGCSGVTGTGAGALRELQRRHLAAVPFENLDVLRGVPLPDTTGKAFGKLVDRGRGGLCFELNRCFGELLVELGFRVTLIAAEVAHRDGFVEGVDHPLLMVAAESEWWLVDVGFGGFSALEPLRFDHPGPQRQFGVTYRVGIEGDHRVVCRQEAGGAWTPLFRTEVSPAARSWADFDEVRAFHETSPESPFTRKVICSKATASGQVLLAGRRLAVLQDGELFEAELDSGGPVFGAALGWILYGHGEFAPALTLGFDRQATPSTLD
ncbi:arylamine N-acetyltransferase family protein [Amycolatopsis anabasis]|uniref:arylamine N-acetyltransferase family protein n=1 Tax=Amycolatopsis anabasis TaxID=1840409 RepID=UPI00131E830F|nr:arylamine N-acetyltransferase [Amycolatopsis anabasis]